jgi:hypothetical protein
MMRRIAGDIEYVRAGGVGDGVTDGGDHVRIAAFGEVGYALDKRHGTQRVGVR